MKPIVLSFCSLFSAVTLHKTKTFLHILDNEPMKTFGSGLSSIMNEHKAKNREGLRPYSTSTFAPLPAPLKFTEFHNHSLLLTMIGANFCRSHQCSGGRDVIGGGTCYLLNECVLLIPKELKEIWSVSYTSNDLTSPLRK